MAMVDNRPYHRIFRHTAALTFADLINRLSNIVLLAVAARRLGVQGIGIYGTIITMGVFAKSLSNLGMQRVIVRDVSRDGRAASSYFINSAIITVILSVGLWITISCSARWFGFSSEIAGLFMLYGAILPADAIARAGEGILRAQQRMGELSTIRVLTSLFYLISGMIALYLGHGLSMLFGLRVIATCFEASLLVGKAHFEQLRLFSLYSRQRMRWLISEGGTLFMLTFLNMIIQRVDILFLSRITGNASVGIYIIGVRLVEYAGMVHVGATGALFPWLSIRWNGNGPETISTYARLIRIYAVWIFGVALTLAFGVAPFIGMIFGESFIDGIPSLRLLVLAMILDAVTTPANMMIVIRRIRLRRYAGMMAALVCFNLASVILLIPDMAYLGAALATLLTSIVSSFLRIYWVRSIMPPRIMPSLVWRPFAAGMVVTGLIVLTGIHPRGFWIVAAPIIYAIFCLLFDAIPKEVIPQRIRRLITCIRQGAP